MHDLSVSRRLSLLFLVLLLALLLSGTGRAAQDTAAVATPFASATGVESSVVKIFATVRYPDPYRPWTKQPSRQITATGVVIGGKRILTNAHVALYARQIQIQAHQSGDKLLASVEFLAPGIDLAVLKVDDESFFDTHPPVTLDRTLPEVKDTVMVYGYPTGGMSLSITKGIVSRIEFVSYQPPTSGLRIQIDAAINPGNSGGPAMSGAKMIGLAFSRLGGGDNIGYIIPCDEIELFLKDIADGYYDGKPYMADLLQTFENPALRPFLHLDKSVEGMIVNEPYSSDPDYPLKKWDVVTHIGGIPIDNQGRVKMESGLRVRFQYLIQKKAVNGFVPLTVIRGGRELTINLPAPLNRPRLFDDIAGDYPPYFILGPMAFSTANGYYIAGFFKNASALLTLALQGNPIVTRLGEIPKNPEEELVVVTTPFFPNKLAIGYSSAATHIVDSVNGVKIKSLRHLVEVLRDSDEPFFVFKFVGHTETLVFPREEMIESTKAVLSDNDIRSQASADLLKIWRSKP